MLSKTEIILLSAHNSHQTQCLLTITSHGLFSSSMRLSCSHDEPGTPHAFPNKAASLSTPLTSLTSLRADRETLWTGSFPRALPTDKRTVAEELSWSYKTLIQLWQKRLNYFCMNYLLNTFFPKFYLKRTVHIFIINHIYFCYNQFRKNMSVC